MNEGTKPVGTPASPEPEALGLTALQRRRLLLRGVGKGGAVLAAAVPLASFANAPILKTAGGNNQPPRLCTVSGMQSMMPSSAPAMGTCSGKPASYWYTPGQHWPSFVARGQNVNRQTLWHLVFGGSATGDGAKTFEQLLAPGAPADKQVWVRALLNAAHGYPTTFPYLPSQVLTMYTDPIQRPTAQKFFRDWV